MRGIPHMTTVSPALSKYIEGMAKIKGMSISKTIAWMIQEHLETQAKKKERR